MRKAGCNLDILFVRSPYSIRFAKIVNCQIPLVDKQLLYVGFVELGHGYADLVFEHIFRIILDIVGFQKSLVFLLEGLFAMMLLLIHHILFYLLHL